MATPAHEINKAFEEALNSLSQLDRALSTYRDSEEDIPGATTQKAMDALQRLQAVLQKNGEETKELKGRGNVVDLMDRIGPKLDSSSVQTMLGSIAIELSGMLRTVRLVLKEKDSKKIEATGFESMKHRQ